MSVFSNFSGSWRKWLIEYVCLEKAIRVHLYMPVVQEKRDNSVFAGCIPFIIAPHGIAVLGPQAPVGRDAMAVHGTASFGHTSWSQFFDALQLFHHKSHIKGHEKLGLTLKFPKAGCCWRGQCTSKNTMSFAIWTTLLGSPGKPLEYSRPQIFYLCAPHLNHHHECSLNFYFFLLFSSYIWILRRTIPQRLKWKRGHLSDQI